MAECEDQVEEWECGYFLNNPMNIRYYHKEKNNLVNNYKLKQVFSSSPLPTTLQFFPLSNWFLVRHGTSSDVELSFLLLVSKLLWGCATASWGTLEKRCARTLLSLSHGQLPLLLPMQSHGDADGLSLVSECHWKTTFTFSDVFSVSKVSLPFWQKTLFSIRKKKLLTLWMVCTQKNRETDHIFLSQKIWGNKCQVQFLVC